LAIGIAWGALAGELPDIDHRRARVSRAEVSFGVAGALTPRPANARVSLPADHTSEIDGQRLSGPPLDAVPFAG
jgi:hypothetical protein